MAILYRPYRASYRKRGARNAINEINVTPFVDVMLVLLIVFMITAPLLAVGVPLNLPSENAAPLEDATTPLVLSINEKGRVFVQEKLVPISQLAGRLQQIRRQRPNVTLFLRADRTIIYGDVIRIMAIIQKARFNRIALVTERKQAKKRR